MIYLDSSVLVKRYVKEQGSDRISARILKGDRVFTSWLSFAEVLAAFGRKDRQGELSFQQTKDRFVSDWILGYSILELDVGTLAAVPNLVERFPITGADAVHLSAALWLRDMCRLVPEFAAGDQILELGSADEQLNGFAEACDLRAFNPEGED